MSISSFASMVIAGEETSPSKYQLFVVWSPIFISVKLHISWSLPYGDGPLPIKLSLRFALNKFGLKKIRWSRSRKEARLDTKKIKWSRSRKVACLDTKKIRWSRSRKVARLDTEKIRRSRSRKVARLDTKKIRWSRSRKVASLDTKPVSNAYLSTSTPVPDKPHLFL